MLYFHFSDEIIFSFIHFCCRVRCAVTETSCRKSVTAARLDEEGIFPLCSVPISITLAAPAVVAGPPGSSTEFSLSCTPGTSVVMLLRDTGSTPAQRSGSRLWGAPPVFGWHADLSRSVLTAFMVAAASGRC